MNIACCAIRPLSGVLIFLLLTGCGERPPASPSTDEVRPRPVAGAVTTVPGYPIYDYEVSHVWPHERDAFTEGLVFQNGQLLESTGLPGHSSLRRVDVSTGKVVQQATVPAEYFGEGLAALDGQLFQLTWKNNKCFVYDAVTFQKLKEFSYPGEGWGLATDGHSLIMSDGTADIRFLDPATFTEQRRITVLAHGEPVMHLNELEFIQGEIYANVWGSNYIISIDPATGAVTGVMDFTGLLPAADRDELTDVLNGIAYDPAGHRLFVTGKRWPKLFEVRLKLRP